MVDNGYIVVHIKEIDYQRGAKMKNSIERSETIGKLAEALIRVQSEIKDVLKDRKGFNYYYADLASVLEAVRPLASKHGIGFIQSPVSSISESTVGVETLLIHSSGEYISGRIYTVTERLKGMSIAQSIGNAITYLRRYALSSFFGIAQTDNDAQCSNGALHVENGFGKPEEVHEDDNRIIKLKSLLSSCNVSLENFGEWLDKSGIGVSKIELLSSMQIERFIDHFSEKKKQMEKEGEANE